MDVFGQLNKEKNLETMITISAVTHSQDMAQQLAQTARNEFSQFSNFEEKRSTVAGDDRALLFKGNFKDRSGQVYHNQKIIFTQKGSLWQISLATSQANTGKATETFGQMIQSIKVTGTVVKKPEGGGQQQQAAPRPQESGMARTRAQFFDIDYPSSWTPTPSPDFPSFEIKKHPNGFMSRVIGSKVEVLQGKKPSTLEELESRVSEQYDRLKMAANPRAGVLSGSSRIKA